MAIGYLAANIITGLRTDTKPTNVPTNSIFLETDTGRWLVYNGTAWISFYKTRESYAGYVYKDTDGYYISTDKNGDVLNRNNTDASLAINAAVNNIVNGDTLGYGGQIRIGADDFQCKTLVDMSIDTTGYHNVELVGNGFLATRLNFTPGSALTTGIRMKMLGAALEGLRIYGNANVTNLVQAIGKGAGFTRHDYGRIENCYFAGTSATDEAGASRTITSGQKGLYSDGTIATFATYFWNISNNVFDGLDIGMHLYNQHSTSSSQVGNKFYLCEEGARLSGGQYNISNMWHQGVPTIGKYAIRILPEGTGGGNQINITNLHCELHKTTTKCAGVYIEDPVANIRLINIRNAYSDPDYWFSVIDNSGSYGNFDYERMFTPRPSKTLKRVGFFYGTHSNGTGEGMLNARLSDFNTTNIASINASSGITRSFGTGATINTPTGRIYTGNYIIRAANPEWSTRVFFSSITDVRIFIGFIDVYSGASIVSTSDMLNTPRMGCGIWIDTGVSTGIKIMHNDGVGASTTAALTGAPVIENTDTHDIKFTAKDSAGRFTITYDGVETSVTSDIPATGDDIGFLWCIENLAASSKTMLVYYGEVTSDR